MHKVHTTIITLLCFSSYRHVISEFVSFDDDISLGGQPGTGGFPDGVIYLATYTYTTLHPNASLLEAITFDKQYIQTNNSVKDLRNAS
jgi:hypothetical protein